MTPRQATLTEAERKARKMANTAQWQKENTVTVNLRMRPEDRVIYEAYAQEKGLALSRMFRACAEACMRADGWTYQPEAGQGTETEGKADQAEEQAQQ